MGRLTRCGPENAMSNQNKTIAEARQMLDRMIDDE
jgi:hypothetical protein